MVACLSGLNRGVVILMIWVAGITKLELEFETLFLIGMMRNGSSCRLFCRKLVFS